MGTDQQMRRKHVVVYDYGQGALWAFIYADSPGVIEKRYPELEVVSTIPSWMTDDVRAKLEAKETYDLNDPPRGLLADILRQRNQ